MKQNFDLHMHTTYCDGLSSAEEMIQSAIDKGLAVVGISGHSFTPHDPSYCMSREGTLSYIEEISRLKEKYSGQIRVLLGLEMDRYADTDLQPYDYWLGSVHYIFTNDGLRKYEKILEDYKNSDRSGADAAALGLIRFTDWTAVDDEPYDLRHFANVQHMDMLSVAELYFGTVGGIVNATGCDIVGHFDLLTKFNERYRITPDETEIDLSREEAPEGSAQFFDAEDERYIAAWKKSIDRIFEDCRTRYKTGCRNRLEKLGVFEAGDKPVFEINTGAISKGYRTTPYPSADQMDYIRSKGGILILSSDSHKTDTICNKFSELEEKCSK